MVPSIVALIWALSLLLFLLFPLYSRWLSSKERKAGFVLIDFRTAVYPLIIWAIFITGLTIYILLSERAEWSLLPGWSISSFVILLVLSIDLMGSTPVYKSSLHEDRLYRVILDRQRCHGAGLCQDVCPRNCFDLNNTRYVASMPRIEFCVQCGACIVQCPFDALCFRAGDGRSIGPETLRKYKLDLMGKRIS
jgi:ferredoxin